MNQLGLIFASALFAFDALLFCGISAYALVESLPFVAVATLPIAGCCVVAAALFFRIARLG